MHLLASVPQKTRANVYGVALETVTAPKALGDLRGGELETPGAVVIWEWHSYPAFGVPANGDRTRTRGRYNGNKTARGR